MVDSNAIETAANALRAAYSGSFISPLRDSVGSSDPVVAYAIQEYNTKIWLAEGRRLVGRKIGATSVAVQTMLGLDQPDYGMLFSDMAFSDGEEIPVGRVQQPKVEGEIAFAIGQDLDSDQLNIADILSAIDYAVAAIEIVGSRIDKWDIGILDTIADNASAGLFVLGSQPRKLAEFDPVLCGMVIERNGDPISTGAGIACLGNPLTATLWLARKMVEVGRPLKKGDLVMSGALGPLAPVAAGDSVELRISGVGSVRAHF
ncbi:fumarylacetoacetate hydrolase family protein [Sphingomonadaceae bacterium G21617-S1]|jgi:2-keto-4-pentenoate hydratase|uniref:2-keto-4-pentenoate hydratase n=1 Tax=Sphingobium sp. YC-XJ3 TaxID=3024245 RepID=UPI0022BC4A62|nr:fumarylacetoacetate hydrolase family protein [Sphingobium sp. YC-XJ3]MCZ4344207.1 fumarylacetoacetate hydrolase family protein [Sphingomonadaceae bacterium G21617-S1]WDA34960.1 fumarylacetoacetate hydrolase family protein [Sphingobium sp. YC-XJ3]